MEEDHGTVVWLPVNSPEYATATAQVDPAQCQVEVQCMEEGGDYRLVSELIYEAVSCTVSAWLRLYQHRTSAWRLSMQ